jgi:hypothetical protein
MFGSERLFRQSSKYLKLNTALLSDPTTLAFTVAWFSPAAAEEALALIPLGNFYLNIVRVRGKQSRSFNRVHQFIFGDSGLCFEFLWNNRSGNQDIAPSINLEMISVSSNLNKTWLSEK